MLDTFRSSQITRAVQLACAGAVMGTPLAYAQQASQQTGETAKKEGGAVLPEVRVVDKYSPFDPMPERKGFKADYQESSTKASMSLRETPQAISVVTRDSIDARQARDLTSALELVAGVTASGGSTTGGPFAGRGLAQGESFVIRGQELNDLRDIRVDGFAVPASNFDMAAFERIDVVKGPSSMLYGQGSLGGFVNMVRKKPEAERSSSVAFQAGSWNTYRVEADATGAINEAGNVRGRITAAFDDGDSFIDGVHTRVAMIAPSIEARISERTRALLQILYQDETFVPSHGIPLRTNGTSRLSIPDIPRSRYVGIPSQTDSTAQNLLTSLRVDHQLSDDWLATVMLQNSTQDFKRYFDGYAHGGLAANGDTNIYADRATLERETWAGELRLDGKFKAFGRDHQLLLGLEQNKRKDRTAFGYAQVGTGNIYTDQYVITVPGGAASLPFNFDNDTVSKNKAVYAQAMLSMAERTKLIVGGRYDRANQSTYDNMAGAAGDSKTDGEFTMRVGLTHDITRNMTGYLSYAESFNPISDVSRSGEILEPETGKGYEAGLKTEWFDGKLGANLAIFRQDLENTAIPDPVNINFSINGGKQRTDGVELELTGSPMPGLTLGAAAAWLDAEYIDRGDPYFGMKPYGSVDNQFSLFASYEVQGGDWRGFGIGATLVSVGERFLGYPGMSQWVGGTVNDRAYLDGYERVDLNLYYKGLPKWDFAFQVRNLFDEVYIERFRDIESNNYFGAPRSFLFRAKYTL